ncbi:MAG: hypothetical protein DRI34_12445 [Deltaproteobacteria bacterium]|nr:MAG: hypothetical protein DRI34_12445 [Deltaproteobacteria bacterium]
MKKAMLMWGMAMLLLGPAVARAALSYTDSHGVERVLLPSPAHLAVVPAAGVQARQELALQPAFDFEAGILEHGDLWVFKLRPQYQGRGEEIGRRLVAAGLAERAGLVFAVRGSEAFYLLDRGVLVRFAAASADAAGLLASAGLEIERILDRRQAVYLCRAGDAEAALAAARLAARLPGVEWALPDFAVPITLYYTPNDPYYGEQWHHQQSNGHHIHSQEAWDVTFGDGQVIVAVVDTGLDEGHPDFDPARIVTGYDVPGGDNDPTPPADSMNAHGTCCSGEIAASMNNSEGGAGVCPSCSLMGVRMMDAYTTYTELAQGYQAINYATSNGAWVISNSWGITQDIIDGGQVDMAPFYTAVQNAVNNGRGGLGAVVLFASGNGDSSGNAVAIGPGELANMAEVMAVGGTDDNDIVVSYSNYGPNLSVVAPTGGSGSGDPQILTTDTIGSRGFSRNGTFWAPGFWGDYDTGMPEPDNTGNYTRYFNGTSAACPIAAGVVALVFSANPTLTGAEARCIVEQTADKVGGVSYDGNGHNNYYGYGRVNAGRAVRAAELGFDNPLGSLCAEDFNCANDDCQKDQAGDFYGYCGGQDCSTLPDGTPCDDGDPCTENDTCSGGSCSGTPRDCSDGNPCTDDACDPGSG